MYIQQHTNYQNVKVKLDTRAFDTHSNTSYRFSFRGDKLASRFFPGLIPSFRPGGFWGRRRRFLRPGTADQKTFIGQQKRADNISVIFPWSDSDASLHTNYMNSIVYPFRRAPLGELALVDSSIFTGLFQSLAFSATKSARGPNVAT